jgi:hypothetical protein
MLAFFAKAAETASDFDSEELADGDFSCLLSSCACSGAQTLLRYAVHHELLMT